MARRTLARPLGWLFAALIVYASLYPFAGWRPSGGPLWFFLLAPLPRYWSAFDLISNLLGYMPLGFLLALVALRSGSTSWRWALALLAPSALSLSLETLQVLLPVRVPSNVDWALNTLGGWLGVGAAWGLGRAGLLGRWQRFRSSWFVADGQGALVLLALWPVALLYPAPVPFGLGQVWSRAEPLLVAWLTEVLSGGAFEHWAPTAAVPLPGLNPLGQVFVVALCFVAPVLLSYSVIRGLGRRVVVLVATLVGGVLLEGLSAALTYGPSHAWAWLTPPVWLALLLGAGLSVAGLGLTRRACVVALLLVVATSVTVLNRSPDTPYLAESLGVWAQGRFIRFHGLTQWVGWLWPYAVLVHAALSASRRGRNRREADRGEPKIDA